MKLGAIDSSSIDAMLAQLKGVASHGNKTTGASEAVAQPSFADALSASLDQVNQTQSSAEALGKNFAMGDDTVQLSDVMVAMQKANISLQTTLQVRNKLVSAYHEIMNMQV